MEQVRRFVHALPRRKPNDFGENQQSELKRCLGPIDLTALGKWAHVWK